MMCLVSGATASMRKLDDSRFGRLFTAEAGNTPTDDRPWAVDNSAFKRFNERKYLRLLDNCHRLRLRGCLFVTAPDVVGDAEQTIRLFEVWESRLRRYGYPVAFVAQDGLTVSTTPWGRFDVLFIGGTTKFKLSVKVHTLAGYAHARGVPIHAGRVNSWKRLRWARRIGARTTDGTYVSRWPDIGLAHMQNGLNRLDRFPELPL